MSLMVNPTLAKEWHPTKNGKLLAEHVMPGSEKKVWWLCAKGHEWVATIGSRSHGAGCPFCSNRRASSENCLETINPGLAKEWHPNKNGSLTPKDVLPGSGKRVWWLCNKKHVWEATIDKRSHGRRCPYCSGKLANAENCFASHYPKLAKEWHPTKNGNLTPQDITSGSDKKVWWLCSNGHAWIAMLSNRVKGNGCPYCANQSVNLENCLYTVNPTLTTEWHPTKNGSLTPKDVTTGANRKVWWLCAKGHVWQARVADRGRGNSCPFCYGREATRENSLATVNPQLAKEWHSTKNGNLQPIDFTPKSNKEVWWHCIKGHDWSSTISNRAAGRGCPFCSPKTSYMELRVYTEIKYLFDDAQLRKKVFGMECDIYIPSLKLAIELDGAYWHRNKQTHDLNKNNVLQKNGILLLRIRESGLSKISEHDIVYTRKKGDIEIVKEVLCSICKMVVLTEKCRAEVYKYIEGNELKNTEEFIKLYSLLPSAFPGTSLMDLNGNVAREWHPKKNGNLTPNDVTPGSGIKIWWLCAKGHEWQAIIASRTRGSGCPVCAKEKRKRVYGYKEKDCPETL